MDTDQIQKWYERNKILMEFLAEKSRVAQVPASMSELSRVFVSTTKQNITLSSMKFKISRLRQRIPSMDVFDKSTRIKMMFVLSAEIDDAYLEELRNDALVEVDSERRIIKYKANDGSLEFEGDQSRSAKIRYGREAIRKRGVVDNAPVPELVTQPSQVLNENVQARDDFQENQLWIHDDKETVRTNIVHGEESNSSKNEGKKQLFFEDDSINASSAKKKKPEAKQENIPFPASYSEIMKAGQTVTDTTSVQEFLTMMKFVVEDLNSPILSTLQQKIYSKIEKYKNKILRIPVVDVLNTFLITVRVSTKYDFDTLPQEVSTNLRDFFMTIQIASTSMNTPGLSNFESEMEKASYQVGEYQRIPLEKIRSGLDLAIEYILP